MSLILAIESSCDETSAAVISEGKLLSNIVASQSVHEAYGGVVPELASRAHQKNIVPVIDTAVQEAGINKKALDAIAFTRGPGLLGALLVGTSFAKGMALALNIPLIEVNHMQAHILAHFINPPYPPFPFICLTVSGGHTQLVLVRDYLDMEIIGETQDDAVGEAFDKTAKLLGFPYPGGPQIDKWAKSGNPKAFKFPKVQSKGLDFSFSGIKTAFLYFLRDGLKKSPDFIESHKADICASIQYALLNILEEQLTKAANQYHVNAVAIAGGVAANSSLRERLLKLKREQNWEIFIPEFQYCTDNAAMIAMAGHYLHKKNRYVGQAVSPMPRMKMN